MYGGCVVPICSRKIGAQMKLTDDELDAILAWGGLALAEPHHASCSYRKAEWLLTTCLACGVTAHYRLAYVLDKNRIGEGVCRACYWRAWYRESDRISVSQARRLLSEGWTMDELRAQGVIEDREGLTEEEAARFAREHGYALDGIIRAGRSGNDILLVTCLACGRRSAMRPGDVAFGCTCRGKRG